MQDLLDVLGWTSSCQVHQFYWVKLESCLNGFIGDQ